MKAVESVKTPDQLHAIEHLLSAKHGRIYADVWRLGLNTALRITDLLNIRYSNIDTGKRLYTLKEGKTGKARTITLNQTALAIVERRRSENPDDEFLFQSHSPKLKRGVVQPVSRVSVSRRFKAVGDELKLSVNTHSMRKSRGYAMFAAGKPIEYVSKVLNHSSTGVTMRYIGIEAEDIARSYDEFEL
jgi:integrase